LKEFLPAAAGTKHGEGDVSRGPERTRLDLEELEGIREGARPALCRDVMDVVNLEAAPPSYTFDVPGITLATAA
jgi:hypothetical protein